MAINFTRHHYPTLASTQDACRALAEQDAPQGTLVTADEQTAGRGRMGHTWFSPRGQAVYASILLRPVLSLRQSPWLTMMAALAILEGWKVGRLEGLSLSNLPTFQPSNLCIKWLNDINLNGKKICGILVETSITEDKLDYAILGIGLNVNTDFADAPEDVRARATSLKQEFGAELDRDAILQTLLQNLGARYNQLQRTQRSPAIEYMQHLETLGQPVRVQAGDEIIEGAATGVDEWGALLIQTNKGMRSVSFGHIL